MHISTLSIDTPRMFAIIMEPGDEVTSGLDAFHPW